jgi:regulator of replication initiation timing
MQSAQESLAELRAAIRYCENAISAAESTIESMDFRQQLAKQQAMNKQESTGREDYLESALDDANSIISELRKREKELKEANISLVCDNDDLKDKVHELESKVQGQYDDIVLLERDLTAKTAQAGAWKKEIEKLCSEKEASSGPCGCQAYRDLEEKVATMPVIPRDVAIAIFREGIKQGVDDVCNELRGQTIVISENEYVGDFEVSFSRDIDLDDEVDLDWVSDKVGSYDTESVTKNLKGLCKNSNFECRIHGIDDNE